MLRELYIKNMAVIDELRVQFDTGFQVLTGETGAGKTILVEAIGLILGNRPSEGLIRDGASEAVIEACFDISTQKHINTLLESESLTVSEYPNELIIRRNISATGQNKVYINNQRSSVGFLQKISVQLIDFTGQHEQTVLLDSDHDIEILDSFVSDKNLYQNYSLTFTKAQSLERQLRQLKELSQQKSERLDWLNFQLREFEKLQIRTDEQETEWRALRARLKNQNVIRQFEDMAAQTLTDGQGNSIGAVKNLRNTICKNQALTDIYGGLLKRIDEAQVLLEDLAYEISKAGQGEGDVSRLTLDEVETGLFNLENLKRKYGPNLADVLGRQAEVAREINSLQNADSDLERLEGEFEAVFDLLKTKAHLLSRERHRVRSILEKRVKNELANLLMPGVTFEIQINTKVGVDLNRFANYSSHGIDEVVLMLSPNPGLAARPLSQIASGGETSRIFLALKKVLAQKRQGGTLIFDEIDTGISGAAVELVGHRLKELAKNFQVFCVTHHAQIASQADRHYYVHKQVQDKKTITRIKTLSESDRVKEVARLMGGVQISKKNLAYAVEMVEKRGNTKH